MDKLKTILQAQKEVFGNFRYIALAVAIFLATLLIAIWLPNISFMYHTITSDSLTFSQKKGIIVASLGALFTNFSTLSLTLTLLNAVLFGINISMMVYYFKKRASLQKRAVKTGFFGILAGFLGIGCASCGSVLLTAIFGLGFTSSFLGFLPLSGQEFTIFGAVLLLYSLYLISKKIKNPMVCK